MELNDVNEYSLMRDSTLNQNKSFQVFSKLSELEVSFRTSVPPSQMPIIKSSNDAQELFRGIFNQEHMQIREESAALFLNKANKVVGAFRVSVGGLTGTVVDIRLILGIALKVLACGIIIAHNHPSGSLVPSRSDETLTKKLKDGAALMDITLFDHLILSSESYYSFADEGLI